jgi:CLIP-associating protein 1/2
VASARDLEHEFADMFPHFEGKETERNWLPRDKSITRIRGMLKGDVHIRFPEGFLHGLRSGMLEASLKTVSHHNMS